MTTTDIELTEEQEAAVDHLARLGKQVQTLGGFAGTGKTTVVRQLVDRLPGFAVCAYTGKAAHVLRSKGIPTASTIHSLIYRPIGEGDDVHFELRPSHELEVDGFLVDEASMVGVDINRDLRSYGLPIIFIGDHGQLEPVGSDTISLMLSPDITLEKIHRNAGEVARFAEHLRMGGAATDWVNGEPEDGATGVRVVTGRDLHEGRVDVAAADQLICAYNRTRVDLNRTLRQYHHGHGPDAPPAAGDRVMCLQNSREHGIFNGMQGTIDRINRHQLWFTGGDGRTVGPVPYIPEAFGSEKKPKYERGRIPFDWAYCVTCHKAQGDEWGDVLVVEQNCTMWDMRRWSYTAASRAKKKLTWVLG